MAADVLRQKGTRHKEPLPSVRIHVQPTHLHDLIYTVYDLSTQGCNPVRGRNLSVGSGEKNPYSSPGY